MIPRETAVKILPPLREALVNLREFHSLVHAVAVPDLTTHTEPAWLATQNTRGMLVAIWQAYPELDDRDVADPVCDWELATAAWQWGRAWE